MADFPKITISAEGKVVISAEPNVDEDNHGRVVGGKIVCKATDGVSLVSIEAASPQFGGSRILLREAGLLFYDAEGNPRAALNQSEVLLRKSSGARIFSIDVDGAIFGDKSCDGRVELKNRGGNTTIELAGAGGDVYIGGSTADGYIACKNTENEITLEFRGKGGDIYVGGNNTDGYIACKNTKNEITLEFRGKGGDIHVGGNNTDGYIACKNTKNEITLEFRGKGGDVHVGGNNTDGYIACKNTKSDTTLELFGKDGDIVSTGAISAVSVSGDTIVANGTLRHQRVSERSAPITKADDHWDLFAVDVPGCFVVELAVTVTDPNIQSDRCSYLRWVLSPKKGTNFFLEQLEGPTAGQDSVWKETPRIDIANAKARLTLSGFAVSGAAPYVLRDGTISVRALYGALLNF